MTKTGEPLCVATMYREYLPQHGMYAAVSPDGIHFTNFVGHSSPLYAPESGVRDPAILFYEGQFWLAYSSGWPPEDLAAYLYLATSPDLVTWTFRVAIRASEDTGASVDVPQWLIDSSGTVHLIGCIGATHHWVEIHAKSPDSSTWNAASNWSEKRDLLDHRGTSLIQGNSFVTRSAGTWYMIFDPFAEMTMGLIDGRYYLRTSPDLVANWSDARLLDLDSNINNRCREGCR